MLAEDCIELQKANRNMHHYMHSIPLVVDGRFIT
jgi:hypothetical protein